MVDRMISPFTLSAGPVLFTLAIVMLSSYATWSGYLVTVAIYFLWILFSRTMRMLPHFWRVPGARRRAARALPPACVHPRAALRANTIAARTLALELP
jgi:hypothetical protein